MATVLTGRDVTLEIDSKIFAPQTLSAELTIEENRETFETLAGRVHKHLDEEGTLEVTMLADWGGTNGLCAALWDAADSDPDTPLDFTMEVNGDTFAGEVFPVKPPTGGQGNEASEISVTLPVKGKPSRTQAA